MRLRNSKLFFWKTKLWLFIQFCLAMNAPNTWQQDEYPRFVFVAQWPRGATAGDPARLCRRQHDMVQTRRCPRTSLDTSLFTEHPASLWRLKCPVGKAKQKSVQTCTCLFSSSLPPPTSLPRSVPPHLPFSLTSHKVGYCLRLIYCLHNLAQEQTVVIRLTSFQHGQQERRETY